MQTFQLSDGKVFKGVLTSVRINREAVRDVIILAVPRREANIFAQYDRSLRLNQALHRMFVDRHPDLEGDKLEAAYNEYEPSETDLDEAAFRVDQRIVRTDGLRELVNGELHCYYSPRLSRQHNGAPTLVTFTPKEQREAEPELAGEAVFTAPDF